MPSHRDKPHPCRNPTESSKDFNVLMRWLWTTLSRSEHSPDKRLERETARHPFHDPIKTSVPSSSQHHAYCSVISAYFPPRSFTRLHKYTQYIWYIFPFNRNTIQSWLKIYVNWTSLQLFPLSPSFRQILMDCTSSGSPSHWNSLGMLLKGRMWPFLDQRLAERIKIKLGGGE